MTSAISSASDVAAAASPVLGQQPDRPAGGEVSTEDSAPATDGIAAGVEVDPDGPLLPSVAVYEAKDGRVHYASPTSKLTRTNVASGEWTEVDGSAHPFDPTNKLVRDVIAHLEQHADDHFEVERVKAAEAEGQNRPTIADWQPDQQ